jgi:hypothetical protein
MHTTCPRNAFAGESHIQKPGISYLMYISYSIAPHSTGALCMQTQYMYGVHHCTCDIWMLGRRSSHISSLPRPSAFSPFIRSKCIRTFLTVLAPYMFMCVPFQVSFLRKSPRLAVFVHTHLLVIGFTHVWVQLGFLGSQLVSHVFTSPRKRLIFWVCGTCTGTHIYVSSPSLPDSQGTWYLHTCCIRKSDSHCIPHASITHPCTMCVICVSPSSPPVVAERTT